MASPGTFKRTLLRHPDHDYRCQMAAPYRLTRSVATPPKSFFLFCKKLSYWLNNRDGDCVTAEAMYCIDAAMTAAGKGGFVADDAAVNTFGRHYGLMNGADLNQVTDIFAKDGFTDQGNTFKFGEGSTVNYKDLPELNAAIFEAQSSVQIAIAANQLEAAAGQGTINFLYGSRPDKRTDHCTGLGCYGEAQELLDALNSFYAGMDPKYQAVSLPSGLKPTTDCQVMFSWDKYFICENGSVVDICDEANIRQGVYLNGSLLSPIAPTPPPSDWPQPDLTLQSTTSKPPMTAQQKLDLIAAITGVLWKA